MAQPITPDYGQQFLFPPALEDWVIGDHPARFLREFVDQLDLPALGFTMPAAMEGRPPYAPSLLLKIWLYGYYHRIRSTRKLETACREHLSLLWLTGLIQPDHNSLWHFWRDNKKALQALDGTKIQAAGSGPKGWSKEYMEKLLTQLDTALDDLELKVVAENADADEPGYRLPAGLAGRQALREEIKKGLAQLEADGRNHYHPVEAEARRMKVGDTNRYADNAQAVADGKEGVIVACDANRQETDNGQLVPMVQQARENLGVAAPATVTLADTGYGAGGDLQAAAEKEILVLVPPAEGAPAKDNLYASQHFHYDPAGHTVTCPQGRTLDYEGHTSKDGVRVERFRCHRRDCPMRARCTGDPKGRQIEIRPHREEVQAMRRRLQDPDSRALWEQRARIIEPRFGQIKQHDGFRRWTVWGLEGVKTPWTMLCATLNLRILYRHWQAGRGPEKESPLAVLSLKMAIRESTPSGGIQNQFARWGQKLLALAAARSRVRPTGFPFAFATIQCKNF
jgi:transposase